MYVYLKTHTDLTEKKKNILAKQWKYRGKKSDQALVSGGDAGSLQVY